MSEVWKKVPELEYEANECGEIKSPCKRYGVLKGYIDKDGYRLVYIKVDGVKKHRRIHRLIAQTFIPNPENKPTVNHKNGDKLDNRVENLEWCTVLENNLHAFENGLNLGPRGEKARAAKLTEEKVKEIRKLLAEKKLNYREIGEIYNVHKNAIYKIANNLTWRHVDV